LGTGGSPPVEVKLGRGNGVHPAERTCGEGHPAKGFDGILGARQKGIGVGVATSPAGGEGVCGCGVAGEMCIDLKSATQRSCEEARFA